MRYLLFAALAAAFVLVTVHVSTESVAGKVGTVSTTTHMMILPPGSRATILNLD